MAKPRGPKWVTVFLGGGLSPEANISVTRSFHVVRSTRPVVFVAPEFVPPRDHRSPREPEHLAKYVDYPDPQYYLTPTLKYFFRARALQHLRIEQYVRYYAVAGALTSATNEDTVMDDVAEGATCTNISHRHYDVFSETVPEGQRFGSDYTGVEVVRRRHQQRLAVPRHTNVEPLGAKREPYYQSKLLAGLPWHCPERPVRHEDGVVEWLFRCDFPLPAELQGGVVLDSKDIYLGRVEVSYEGLCHEIDDYLSSYEFGLVCTCCCRAQGAEKCATCEYAVGFHYCTHENRDTDKLRWRKGTLFAGTLDVERNIYNMHKKGVPMTVIRQKIDEYVQYRHIESHHADAMVRIVEDERGSSRIAGVDDNDTDGLVIPGCDQSVRTLTLAELRTELEDRENKLQAGSDGDSTDQWRCYEYITNEIAAERPLRLMVQASAGTGKSFLTVERDKCLVSSL